MPLACRTRAGSALLPRLICQHVDNVPNLTRLRLPHFVQDQECVGCRGRYTLKAVRRAAPWAKLGIGGWWSPYARRKDGRRALTGATVADKVNAAGWFCHDCQKRRSERGGHEQCQPIVPHGQRRHLALPIWEGSTGPKRRVPRGVVGLQDHIGRARSERVAVG